MPPKVIDLHHVSFYFGKNRVLFSIPSSTTLADLKSRLLSSLPYLLEPAPLIPSLSTTPPPAASTSNTTPTESQPIDLSLIKTTSDLVLFLPRRQSDTAIDVDMDKGGASGGGEEILGYKSLEGDVDEEGWSEGDDGRGERGKLLRRKVGEMRSPQWGRWVDVYVSFRDKDGSFDIPIYTLPPLEDDEE